ncbi:presenilin-like A22 family membrane protease [Methanolinea mesophila]|uniref:presenilin family intramembrane aspartyl protease PSH n=1 Tax=Methanolinea mesophila TaxID=547055 RepID=UPI001AEAB0C8|nr:presenilin family intramembrane aspartyl protease PSH [Methanolinea mesophila]MBP1929568.1 presenilin-like A22 family membrane protease [Methanolinea mesophila]
MNFGRIMPLLAMPVMLVIVEVGAILLSLPLIDAGIVVFENPESLVNPLIFIAILLVFTGLLLLLIRYKAEKVIQAIILISIFFTFVYIFSGITFVLMGDTLTGSVLALAASIAATVVLYLYPEWYVLDTLGLLIAAGAASIFGISLDVIPVVLLLAALAVYDAISVYRTKHMLTLAEGVVNLKSPILFIVPKKKDYSYRRDGLDTTGEGERSAFLIGMGDLIMPSILVVSANVYTASVRLGPISVPALGAMIGSVLGLIFLLSYVIKGKPQAGLPPINGGAIIGFLIGYLVTVL